uniref:Uncharacterized protein n=1 Tax=viral metagenome TaxID=1070528 RepID=A0A6C0HPD7_9ZZZZ
MFTNYIIYIIYTFSHLKRNFYKNSYIQRYTLKDDGFIN